MGGLGRRRAGFVEIDLVGHEGGNPCEDFGQTLDVTDIATGWTELRAGRNKARRWVFAALTELATGFPFPIKGIDSDNGAEFINAHLLGDCPDRKITFTRSRAGHKNDGAHVDRRTGPSSVPFTKPDTLAATASRRSHVGPVYVFDRQGLAQWPIRLRWAPERGCADPLTAILRARTLTAGAGTNVCLDNGDFWTGMTQAVVRCHLHAAARAARPIRHVLRWAANPADPEPIRILRTARRAAEG